MSVTIVGTVDGTAVLRSYRHTIKFIMIPCSMYYRTAPDRTRVPGQNLGTYRY